MFQLLEDLYSTSRFEGLYDGGWAAKSRHYITPSSPGPDLGFGSEWQGVSFSNNNNNKKKKPTKEELDAFKAQLKEEFEADKAAEDKKFHEEAEKRIEAYRTKIREKNNARIRKDYPKLIETYDELRKIREARKYITSTSEEADLIKFRQIVAEIIKEKEFFYQIIEGARKGRHLPYLSYETKYEKKIDLERVSIIYYAAYDGASDEELEALINEETYYGKFAPEYIKSWQKREQKFGNDVNSETFEEAEARIRREYEEFKKQGIKWKRSGKSGFLSDEHLDILRDIEIEAARKRIENPDAFIIKTPKEISELANASSKTFKGKIARIVKTTKENILKEHILNRRTLKYAGIAGGVLLAGYGAYRLLNDNNNTIPKRGQGYNSFNGLQEGGEVEKSRHRITQSSLGPDKGFGSGWRGIIGVTPSKLPLKIAEDVLGNLEFAGSSRNIISTYITSVRANKWITSLEKNIRPKGLGRKTWKTLRRYKETALPELKHIATETNKALYRSVAADRPRALTLGLHTNYEDFLGSIFINKDIEYLNQRSHLKRVISHERYHEAFYRSSTLADLAAVRLRRQSLVNTFGDVLHFNYTDPERYKYVHSRYINQYLKQEKRYTEYYNSVFGLSLLGNELASSKVKFLVDPEVIFKKNILTEIISQGEAGYKKTANKVVKSYITHAKAEANEAVRAYVSSSDLFSSSYIKSLQGFERRKVAEEAKLLRSLISEIRSKHFKLSRHYEREASNLTQKDIRRAAKGIIINNFFSIPKRGKAYGQFEALGGSQTVKDLRHSLTSFGSGWQGIDSPISDLLTITSTTVVGHDRFGKYGAIIGALAGTAYVAASEAINYIDNPYIRKPLKFIDAAFKSSVITSGFAGSMMKGGTLEKLGVKLSTGFSKVVDPQIKRFLFTESGRRYAASKGIQAEKAYQAVHNALELTKRDPRGFFASIQDNAELLGEVGGVMMHKGTLPMRAVGIGLKALTYDQTLAFLGSPTFAKSVRYYNLKSGLQKHFAEDLPFINVPEEDIEYLATSTLPLETATKAGFHKAYMKILKKNNFKESLYEHAKSKSTNLELVKAEVSKEVRKVLRKQHSTSILGILTGIFSKRAREYYGTKFSLFDRTYSHVDKIVRGEALPSDLSEKEVSRLHKFIDLLGGKEKIAKDKLILDHLGPSDLGEKYNAMYTGMDYIEQGVNLDLKEWGEALIKDAKDPSGKSYAARVLKKSNFKQVINERIEKEAQEVVVNAAPEQLRANIRKGMRDKFRHTKGSTYYGMLLKGEGISLVPKKEFITTNIKDMFLGTTGGMALSAFTGIVGAGFNLIIPKRNKGYNQFDGLQEGGNAAKSRHLITPSSPGPDRGFGSGWGGIYRQGIYRKTSGLLAIADNIYRGLNHDILKKIEFFINESKEFYKDNEHKFKSIDVPFSKWKGMTLDEYTAALMARGVQPQHLNLIRGVYVGAKEVASKPEDELYEAITGDYGTSNYRYGESEYSKRIMDVGEALHLYEQSRYYSHNKLQYAEKKLLLSNSGIRGSIDVVLNDPDNTIVELKSIGQGRLKQLNRAYPAHVGQVEFYLYATGKKKGIIRYVSREDLSYAKEFEVDYDEDIVKKNLAKLARVRARIIRELDAGHLTIEMLTKSSDPFAESEEYLSPQELDLKRATENYYIAMERLKAVKRPMPRNLNAILAARMHENSNITSSRGKVGHESRIYHSVDTAASLSHTDKTKETIKSGADIVTEYYKRIRENQLKLNNNVNMNNAIYFMNKSNENGHVYVGEAKGHRRM